MAVDIGLRQRGLNRLDGIDALIHQAEVIALPLRERRRVGGQGEVGFEFQSGSRRAEEVAAVDREVRAFAYGCPGGRGLEVELKAIGDVVLDEERRFTDRIAVGIGKSLDPPGSALGRRVDRKIERPAAGTLVTECAAPMLDAVGPLDDDCQGSIGHCPGIFVTQQQGSMDRLVAAVDTAFCKDEGIDRTGRCPARHASVAEIEG